MGHSIEILTRKKLPIADSIWQLTIFPVAVIGAKLIGSYGGLQVAKQSIERESRYVEWPR